MVDDELFPGCPLFTSADGAPINFKLLCDPASKERYKKLIQNHGGEVMKWQDSQRLQLAPRSPCVHLHIGCETHAPYSMAAVFNVSWIDHCISASQVLDIKAYLLNPNPQLAVVNYMDKIDRGLYRSPPPPLNVISKPLRSKYSEIRVPFNGANQRHTQMLMKAICSSQKKRNMPHTENSSRLVLSTSPASSDGENLEETIMDCMQGLSSQPSSTPYVPPVAANSGALAPRPGTRLPLLPLALPLSKKRIGDDADETGSAEIPTSTSIARPLQAPPTGKDLEGDKMDDSAPPVVTGIVSTDQQSSSRINHLSISKNSSSNPTTKPQTNPRRRELFDSEHFALKLSDDGSDPENLPTQTRPKRPAAPINLSDGDSSSSSLSPPRRSVGATPAVQPPPRVPTLGVARAKPGTSVQDDSDDFGPPPGAIVKLKGVRQNTRAPYSREEEFTILRYIKASKKFTGLRSNYLWRDMDGKPGLERRTMQSLKDHFLKKMMRNLEVYKIFTEDEIRMIRSTSVNE